MPIMKWKELTFKQQLEYKKQWREYCETSTHHSKYAYKDPRNVPYDIRMVIEQFIYV